jgi:ribosomal protein S18 acetylase RimI-like enzyme
MPDSNGILIRSFKSVDRDDVRRISCETAFLGEPRELFFDDDEILADGLTLYFTDYEPDSCFVAVESEEVIGYIIGTTDVAVMQRIFRLKVAPRLLVKALRKGVVFRRNTVKLLMHVTAGFFKGEFSTPHFSRQYPATLHVNIDENFRGRKIGKQLVEHYLSFLRGKAVRGVHFGTMSEEAKTFFTRLGFTVLSNRKRSYLKYRLGRDVTHYVFGKTL